MNTPNKRQPEAIGAQADAYLTATAGVLDLNPLELANMPVGQFIDMGKLALSCAAAIEQSRQASSDNEAALNTVFSEYLPALIDARTAAHDIDVTEGEFTADDGESLARGGFDLGAIRDYLVPFVMPEKAPMSDDVPPLSIDVALRMKEISVFGGGRYISSFPSSQYDIVSNHDTMKYGGNYAIPVLLDPTTYTLAQFAKLKSEQGDGFSQQVVDTWHSILQSEQVNPAFGGEPLVIRAVAVLPVLPAKHTAPGSREFAIDFIPFLSQAQADSHMDWQENRGYDVRLMVRGNENYGSNYLTYPGSGRQPVMANQGGREAALTIERAGLVEEGLPQSLDDLGLTPRSQGAIALYIAPHIVKTVISAAVPTRSYDHGGPLMLGTSQTKDVRGLGGAAVSVGQGHAWSSTEKLGRPSEFVIPDIADTRPIIYAVQLLTFQH